MDNYGTNKTVKAAEEAFTYIELNFFMLALKECVRKRDLKKRLAVSSLKAFMEEFEVDALRRMTGGVRRCEEPSLLTEDALLILLFRQENIWYENAFRKFISICNDCMRPDTQNRVYVSTWLESVKEAVVSECNDILWLHDKYRGMI